MISTRARRSTICAHPNRTPSPDDCARKARYAGRADADPLDAWSRLLCCGDWTTRVNARAIGGLRSRRRQWTVFVPVTRRSPALQTLGSKLRSSTGLAADVFHPKAAESAEPPSSRRTQPIGLSLLAGNSSRSGSRVLQRSKSLPHAWNSPSVVSNVFQFEGSAASFCDRACRDGGGARKNGDDAESDERGNDHARATRKGVLRSRRSRLFASAAQCPCQCALRLEILRVAILLATAGTLHAT